MTGRCSAAAPLAALLAVAVPAGPAGADFAAGAKAYDGGDYAAAFREWMALAQAGDADAQTAVAGMFRFGEGRAPDPRRAASWYRRAAVQGEPVAQMNLGEMYMLGLGVARDPVEAWAWLSLAAGQGKRWAAERRDALSGPMEAARKRAARQRLEALGHAISARR